MQYHRIYARIDIDAILHNLGECKRRIPEGTKVLAVIKADGYGHGAVELAHQLESEVDYFGVAVIEEAVELRRAGIKKPILILGYTSPSQDDLLINYDITQNIYTYDMAKRLSDRAVALGKKVKFHIGLDTGMSRVGFQDNDESVELIKKIVKLPNLVLEGIFSHYALLGRCHPLGQIPWIPLGMASASPPVAFFWFIAAYQLYKTPYVLYSFVALAAFTSSPS